MADLCFDCGTVIRYKGPEDFKGPECGSSHNPVYVIPKLDEVAVLLIKLGVKVSNTELTYYDNIAEISIGLDGEYKIAYLWDSQLDGC